MAKRPGNRRNSKHWVFRRKETVSFPSRTGKADRLRSGHADGPRWQEHHSDGIGGALP